MSRHYYRDPLPTSSEFIPSIPWGPTQPDISLQRDRQALVEPSVASLIARRSRWSFSISTGELHSRFLTDLDAREINAMLEDVWDKYGESAVKAVVLHLEPEW